MLLYSLDNPTASILCRYNNYNTSLAFYQLLRAALIPSLVSWGSKQPLWTQPTFNTKARLAGKYVIGAKESFCELGALPNAMPLC